MLGIKLVGVASSWAFVVAVAGNPSCASMGAPKVTWCCRCSWALGGGKAAGMNEFILGSCLYSIDGVGAEAAGWMPWLGCWLLWNKRGLWNKSETLKPSTRLTCKLMIAAKEARETSKTVAFESDFGANILIELIWYDSCYYILLCFGCLWLLC